MKIAGGTKLNRSQPTMKQWSSLHRWAHSLQSLEYRRRDNGNGLRTELGQQDTSISEYNTISTMTADTEQYSARHSTECLCIITLSNPPDASQVTNWGSNKVTNQAKAGILLRPRLDNIPRHKLACRQGT